MAGGLLDEEGMGQPLAEINVTPLVDVMLVLLVIFIISAPLMAQALKVNLPAAEAPPENEPHVVELVVAADGGFTLDGDAVIREDMPARLEARLGADPGAVLRLGGDASVPYGEVAVLLSQAQKAGWRRIAFATAPALAPPAPAAPENP